MSLNSTSLISVKQLNKSFGQKHAVNNVNFDIVKGEPVALVGPNGAGKTTLFSLLCGYIQPSSGDISILGHQPGQPELFGKLAALPQDAQLDPRFSIAHQLRFYGDLQGFSRKSSQIEAERTLELVGLKEVLNEKPEALSHGMRKRVTIAQALIGRPEIVMLDEATAGLDPIHAREVRELVASLSDETTFILSSHDLSELERLCHQVLFLENGIMREHHHVSNDNTPKNQQTYMTLRMAASIPSFEQAFESIGSVASVIQTQDKEYLITINSTDQLTDHVQALPVDIQILQLCHDNKWVYRQLVNGKTLENQLFN